jgi:hypothetical protein
MMKQTMAVLFGVAIGAAIVTVVNGANFGLIKSSEAGSVSPSDKCFIGLMEDAYANHSANVLAHYCKGASKTPWVICFLDKMSDARSEGSARRLQDYCIKKTR